MHFGLAIVLGAGNLESSIKESDLLRSVQPRRQVNTCGRVSFAHQGRFRMRRKMACCPGLPSLNIWPLKIKQFQTSEKTIAAFIVLTCRVLEHSEKMPRQAPT